MDGQGYEQGYADVPYGYVGHATLDQLFMGLPGSVGSDLPVTDTVSDSRATVAQAKADAASALAAAEAATAAAVAAANATNPGEGLTLEQGVPEDLSFVQANAIFDDVVHWETLHVDVSHGAQLPEATLSGHLHSQETAGLPPPPPPPPSTTEAAEASRANATIVPACAADPLLALSASDIEELVQAVKAPQPKKRSASPQVVATKTRNKGSRTQHVRSARKEKTAAKSNSSGTDSGAPGAPRSDGPSLIMDIDISKSRAIISDDKRKRGPGAGRRHTRCVSCSINQRVCTGGHPGVSWCKRCTTLKEKPWYGCCWTPAAAAEYKRKHNLQ